MFLDWQEILRFLTLLSQYGVCFLAPLLEPLFMQYMILRVGIHEVLIVIALGHVDKLKLLFHFATKELKKIQPNQKSESLSFKKYVYKESDEKHLSDQNIFCLG